MQNRPVVIDDIALVKPESLPVDFRLNISRNTDTLGHDRIGSRRFVPMKKTVFIAGVLIVLGAMIFGAAQEKKLPIDKDFYENSLHYTAKGLEYWYAKEQGGLERITGVPFGQLPCARCHVRTCDACHRQDVDGRPVYSTSAAQQACEKCHGMESLAAVKENPNDPTGDVHFRLGMKCLDCHTAREIHGDGTPYDSFQQPGAMDTRCEKCHTDLSGCPGSKTHGDKLDCNACHVRDLPSCYNCHFDTRVKEGKSVSLPLKGLLFLVNRRGKVTLGDLHTFVYQNKTMITFAPSFPHWVMKQGRACPDCHHTQVLKSIRAGAFRPVRFEKGQIENIKGIVPVLDGLKWNFVFLNYENGNWVPIPNAAEPLINYAGYSMPLTRAQFEKLDKPQAQSKK